MIKFTKPQVQILDGNLTEIIYKHGKIVQLQKVNDYRALTTSFMNLVYFIRNIK